MAYYIKTVGKKGERKSIFEPYFSRMLFFQMYFKTKKGKVSSLKKRDKLVIYCVKNGVKEFPQGGFIGIENVLSPVYKNMNLFEKLWRYIVDVKFKVYSFRNIITLEEVKNWKQKSKKLRNALKANLEAIGGLWEIERSDYGNFLKAFKERKM